LQYDTRIDNTVVEELSKNGSVSFLKLKCKVEGALNRKLSFQTYNDHLKKMIHDKIVFKTDSYVRGKPVFYSLTEDANKRRQLNLLGINPKQILYRKIYERIFFYEVYHSPLNIIQSENGLNSFLDELKLSKADLKEVRSNTMDERALQSEQKVHITADKIYMLKKQDFWIWITKTEYWEVSKHFQTKYDEEYSFTLPGVSIAEFLNSYSLGTLGSADVDEAFSLLIKNGLIKPGIVIHGEMRYTIADKNLGSFIQDLRQISWIESRLLNHRWYHIAGPNAEEQDRVKWLLGDREANRIFRDAEMSRYKYKKTIKARPKDPSVIDVEKTLKETEIELANKVKEVKDTHGKTIKQYEFLHDVIKMTCPMVLR